MDKLMDFKKTVIPALLTQRILELIILPTEQCNFRCTYCYEDFSIGKMKQSTIDGIKNLITRRAQDIKALKLSWFGGEPLSARNIVYEISDHANQQALASNLTYAASMTTNGFLLNLNVAKKLYAFGVRNYQISLDGPKEIHDRTRLRINQSGSFEPIWTNLLALKESDLNISVMIRIHVTPENYYSLFKLIEQLKIHFGGDTRFKLFFKAIADLGGPHSKKFTTLNQQEKFSAIQQLTDAVDNQIDIVSTKNTQIPYICYASHANSFVIRANGTLGKCTVALSSPANTIGHLNPDGTLCITQDKLQPWLRGLKTQNPSTLKCPLIQFPSPLAGEG